MTPEEDTFYVLQEPMPKIDGDGTKRWFDEKGEPHRENGPAVIWPDASKFWFKNGDRHRENGPAVIWPDGTEEYWENGVEIK